jgi:mono/diheme cytochrome c family protein
VLALALTFALLQDRPGPADSRADGQQLAASDLEQASSLNTRDIEAGRAVYKAMACARCHSIAGEGNPRNPLDHTGARHTAAELRDYIIGAEGLSGAIPQYAIEFKQSYRALPQAELDALVVYMQSLRP